MTNRIHGRSGAIGLATLAMVFGGQLRAQSTFDTRWQAWFGCWQPSEVSALGGTKPSAICVSPVSSTSAVEVAMVQDGAVTTRDTIDASGVARHVDKQGCVGTESGQWSVDNRRVFVHSTMTCAGGLSRSGNTILSMTPSGDWVNVQTLTVGKTTGVRAIHYRDANSLNIAPANVAEAIRDRQLAISAARTEAGTALDVRAVLEAVTRADTAAVQAWIVERGTRFNLDAKQIVALADAGVPSSVTDVMIGVSFPDHFALKPAQPSNGLGGGLANAGDAGRFADGDCGALATSMYGRNACRCRDSWSYDPYFSSGYGDCGLGYRYGYSPYSAYGYPYGYSYGYGAYYPYYGYSAAPVVVVKGDDQPHGRVVNGRGYTQRPASSSSSADAFPSSGSRSGSSSSTSSSGGGGGGGGGSTASSGSSSSGSSGGEVRTAHPRPPM